MKADPILEELWKIKDDLSKDCGHDLRCLFDKLKASQTGPIINLTKRRPAAMTGQ